MRKILAFFLICMLLGGCGSAGSDSATVTPLPGTEVRSSPAASAAVPSAAVAATAAPTAAATVTAAPTTALTPSAAPALPVETPTSGQPTAASTAETTPTQSVAILQTGKGNVPVFDHIVVIMFENHDYNEIIGNDRLTNFNRLAAQNVLFTNYYAVAHPSLPNYLALIGGSTFDITNDCGGCFINNTSLPDLIEASGRTWKTYQEDMPGPCFTGSTGNYSQNHNPFLHFDPIRKDSTRCQRSVVPLTQLDEDLSARQLPNYSFIVPNVCDTAHSCALSTADTWLGQMVNTLQGSPALGQNSMIFIVFDESSSDNSSCCGMPDKAGGRVAAILISPLARSSFKDADTLSHYSLLKTILDAWDLPALGFTANPATQPITAPWK